MNGGTVLNKEKKTLKGFTLIELIIVLAIFSVIMVLVMSFIDPVSRLMSKTSVRERTASYADNIGEYIDKSVRHSQFIRVFENGFCQTSSAGDELTEQQAVEAFVSDYFDEAVNDKLQPVQGKVRVLKMINTPGDGLEAGRVYESVYDFTSGCGFWSKETMTISGIDTVKYVKKWGNVDILYNVGDIRKDNITKVTASDGIGIPKRDAMGNIITDDEGNPVILRQVTETFTEGTADLDPDYTNIPVINPEHFKDYCYYYKYDFQEFKPITDDDAQSYGLETSSRYYYSRVVPREKSGVNMLLDSVNDIGMVLNIVAYQDNAKGNNKFDITYEAADGTDVSTSVFRSPAYMDTVSMTFQNAIKQDKALSFYSVKRYKDEDSANDVMSPDTGKAYLTSGEPAIVNIDLSNQFLHTAATGDAAKNDNIYIIYAVPSEIEDTEWTMD